MNKVLLTAAVVGATAFIASVRKDLPKGVDNNNPLNIRFDDRWEWNGQLGQDNDGFVIFDSPQNGIRAAAKNLDSYKKRGVATLRNIVAEWAPPHENDTESYINKVASTTGLLPDSVVQKDDYVVLLYSMIHHENGFNPYPIETVQQGVDSAYA